MCDSCYFLMKSWNTVFLEKNIQFVTWSDHNQIIKTMQIYKKKWLSRGGIM